VELEDGQNFRKAGEFGPMAGHVNGALGLKVAHPERTVVVGCGDGCYLLSGFELMTAVQYTSAAFASLASDCDVTLSLGRTGQCWDNALSESFFASIKGELLDHQAWPTRAAARRAIVEYIGWYNAIRLHSSLGYRSPAEFENSHHDKIRKVA
jgi:transposase InsO family protein